MIRFHLPEKKAGFYSDLLLEKKCLSSNNEKFLLYSVISIVSLQEGTSPALPRRWL